MKKTNYKIIQERERFTVIQYDNVVSKGFITIEDALHSVWILNGSIPEHFYIEKENDIYLTMQGR